MRVFTGPKLRRRRPATNKIETVLFKGRKVPVISLAELHELDVRNLNELSEHGILYVHQLAGCTAADLATFSNFGEKAVAQCRAVLSAAGFDQPDW